MACFRWLLYTAPQSSLLRPRKLFLFAFETATWHVFRHPVKASKAQNLRSFWGYLLLPLLLPSSAATFASTRPHLPDFLTVSEQPFVTFGSEAPCLPDLARVLRCNLPPLLLQAVPAHTTSSLRRVPCCFPLWFYTALPAKPCQASFQGVGGTRASAHLYLMKAKKTVPRCLKWPGICWNCVLGSPLPSPSLCSMPNRNQDAKAPTRAMRRLCVRG